MIKRFLADDRGTTAIEYAMIVALVSIIIVGATASIGAKLNAKFLGPIMGGLG